MSLKRFGSFAIALAALALTLSTVAAAVDFDAETGEGFVGKGDVQTALGYNNKQLQDNAEDLVFSASSVSETTWVCQRDAGTQTQERATTTTTQGVVSKVLRERNQVTGFILNGYDGDPVIVHDGPDIGSCPTFWSEVPDSRETTPGETILYVDGVALQ